MNILSYNIPCSSFPRMNYAQRNGLDIYNAYNAFVSGFVMQENEIVTYDHVVVHICKKCTDRNFPVDISDIVTQEDGTIPVEKATCENINLFVDQTPTQINAVSVIILDESQYDEICKIQNNSYLFVLLSRSPTEKGEDKFNNISFSTKDCVRTDICNLLETVVLKPMKDMSEFLCKVRNSFATPQADHGKEAGLKTVYNTRLNAVKKRNEIPAEKIVLHDRLCNSGLKDRNASKRHTRYQGTTTCHHYMNTRSRKEVKSSTAEKRTAECLDLGDQNSMKKKYRNDRHLQQFALNDSGFIEGVDKETVERLLKSMLVLYGMSNIKENERPHIPDNYTKELNDKLCRELFNINTSVKGIGYHYDTLQFFISEQDVDMETALRKQIENVLSQYKITDFETVQVSNDVHYLMHVGAKLEPVPGYGTLGCFATMGGVTKCILLSRHVARCGEEMFFESRRKVCKILPDTLKHEPGDLDIAAAEIYPKEGICSTEFKDSAGKEMKGRLHEYRGRDKLFTEEQKVHIWGASSKPGKGVITMPEVVIRDKESSQVLVEIKDGDTKFADEGDSGAVVCADDPDGNFVFALGMVMGEVLKKKRGNGRRYYVLPLSTGLKQLERLTGKTFELC